MVNAGPGLPYPMQEASDWTFLDLNGAGNRKITASAALSARQARVSIRVDITGI